MYTGQSINLDELFTDNYDIDHIYPRALTKDDSVLNNKVLVNKKANADKGDIYPINSAIQSRMLNYWRYLHSIKLITDEKYNRLSRQTELTDIELAGFIERQLVETNQTVKELARILKEHYPETKIVYSKANNVTEFRKDFELTKVREINDLHHAKDAYLNIVVGNIFDVKYGSDFKKYYANKSNQKNRIYYNLNKIYENNVENNDYTAWDVKSTLNNVKKQYHANDCIVTKMPIINKGTFYDENAVSAKKGLIPLKMGRLSDTSKYGGYSSVKPAYFFAVEYIDKNKRKVKIDTIPVLKQIRGNNDALIKYCIENLNLENPKIIIPEIKKYSLIQYNGNNLYIAGNEETQILYHNAKQLIISKEYILDIKKICRFIDKSKGKDNVKVTSSDDITAEKNQEIFNMLIDRIGKEYGYILSSTYKKLNYNTEAFSNYCIEDQCQIIYNMLALTKCSGETADLSIYNNEFTNKLVKNEGRIRNSKNITDVEVYLINQSVTGLFSNNVCINKNEK